MKTLALILILLPMVFGFKGADTTVKKLEVRKESKISILGSSNVNNFSFEIKHYSGNDTLVLAPSENQCSFFKKGLLRLEVSEFRNSNPMLTKDFRKVIKAKNYPEILMLFKNLSHYPGASESQASGVAEVQIFLAGQNKTTKLNITTIRSGGVVYMCGSVKLCFSDFGLTAPEKVMGFIDVKDELTVNFKLALREI